MTKFKFIPAGVVFSTFEDAEAVAKAMLSADTINQENESAALVALGLPQRASQKPLSLKDAFTLVSGWLVNVTEENIQEKLTSDKNADKFLFGRQSEAGAWTHVGFLRVCAQAFLLANSSWLTDEARAIASENIAGMPYSALVQAARDLNGLLDGSLSDDVKDSAALSIDEIFPGYLNWAETPVDAAAAADAIMNAAEEPVTTQGGVPAQKVAQETTQETATANEPAFISEEGTEEAQENLPAVQTTASLDVQAMIAQARAKAQVTDAKLGTVLAGLVELTVALREQNTGLLFDLETIVAHHDALAGLPAGSTATALETGAEDAQEEGEMTPVTSDADDLV